MVRILDHAPPFLREGAEPIQSFVRPHDGVFDPETTRHGRGIRSVCEYLGFSTSPLIRKEAASRIIGAARLGERDPLMLRAAGLDPRTHNAA